MKHRICRTLLAAAMLTVGLSACHKEEGKAAMTTETETAFTGDSRVQDVMQDSAFAGFGRLIFPVDMRIDNALTLKNVEGDRNRTANLRLCWNAGRHRLLPDHAAEDRVDPRKRNGGRNRSISGIFSWFWTGRWNRRGRLD